MAKTIVKDTGWKTIRVHIEGAPARTYTVKEVRDAVENYKRDMRLHPTKPYTDFVCDEIR